MAGRLIIAGGIACSLLIPQLLDKFDRPRLLLGICLAPSLLLVHGFVFAGSPLLGYAWGAPLGFLWLPSLAIAPTIIERIAHKDHASAASGIFWMIGNAGRPAPCVSRHERAHRAAPHTWAACCCHYYGTLPGSDTAAPD